MPGTIEGGMLQRAHAIAAHPFVIETDDNDVGVFLVSLPEPNFQNTADAKALWAARAENAGQGTEIPEGSAYVVSAEAFKRIRAHRFTL